MIDLPNSDSWLLCHVNVTPAIKSYWPLISPSTQLVTDFQETYTAPDNPSALPNRASAIASYNAVLADFPNHCPAIVGTYKSSRDCELSKYVFTYPRRSVEQAGIDPAYFIGTNGPHCNMYDYRRKEVRDYAMWHLIDDVTKVKAPLVYLDNVSNAASGWLIDWVTTMDCVKQISKALHAAQTRLIINAAWALSGDDSDASITEFLGSMCDGVSLEMSYLSYMRNSVDLTNKGMQEYRRILDAGRTLIFISAGDLPRSTPADLLTEGQVLSAFAMMFRKPGDKLFVAHPFWLSLAPSWASWPADLGPAAGEAVVTINTDGQVVLNRQFQNANLTLNATTLAVTKV